LDREFQSTHPRGVRPAGCPYWDAIHHVSIHAPTRGATPIRQRYVNRIRVSIHAPTRGATQTPSFIASRQVSFNPRTHAGCDRRWCIRRDSITSGFNPRTHAGCDYMAGQHPGSIPVSIHAPTRGATEEKVNYSKSTAFQSTHPRGVRPPGSRIQRGLLCFNPRTHAGCDGQGIGYAVALGVSIHAPTRGATPSNSRTIPTDRLFQSTHPRGVRPLCT